MLQAQIYLDRDELRGSILLYEFIMRFLSKQNVGGGTAFSGEIGFGLNQQLTRPTELFSFDEVPMMITFIDEDEKVKTALKTLREQWKGGLIVTHQVEEW